MLVDEKMFPDDSSAGNHSLIFMAGFHIGIPLFAYRARQPGQWTQIRERLSEHFSHAKDFRLADIQYHPETFFPLGNPLAIQYAHFFRAFDICAYVPTLGRTDYQLDHLIWICPNGVVLLMAQISSDDGSGLALAQLEEIVEGRYAELTFVFNEIADAIFACVPTTNLTPLLSSAADVAACKQAIGCNRKFLPHASQNDPAVFQGALQSIRASPEMLALYEDILFDVYFIEYTRLLNAEEINIGYVHAAIRSPDRSYLPLLGIAFSSFVGLLWIQKRLRRDLHELQGAIAGVAKFAEKSYAALKLFRMFVISSIVEASPINVRLKARYMQRLKEFWLAEEMPTLVDQINKQLATMEEMFKWIEDSKSATRTFRFAVGGVLFALLSVTSTVNSLITTFDVNKQVGVEQRIALMLVGLGIVVILYLGVWKLRLPGRG